jgi:hypothetical protein
MDLTYSYHIARNVHNGNLGKISLTVKNIERITHLFGKTFYGHDIDDILSKLVIFNRYQRPVSSYLDNRTR